MFISPIASSNSLFILANWPFAVVAAGAGSGDAKPLIASSILASELFTSATISFLISVMGLIDFLGLSAAVEACLTALSSLLVPSKRVTSELSLSIPSLTPSDLTYLTDLTDLVEDEGKHPTKARMSRSQIKTILICFLDIRGIVHREFIPQGQTVTAVFYIEVLKRLSRVRPELAKNGWILHHDNAPAYTLLKVQQFLTSKNITTLPHPPYIPDLAPLYF